MNYLQLVALKAAIMAEADPEFVAHRTAGNTGAMADWFNRPSTYVVWRTAVPPEEYREAIVWTEYDGLAAGKRSAWEFLTGMGTLDVNASKANVRQGLAAWFSGTTLSNMLVAAKRYATVGEKLFATGSGTTGSPGTLTFEGEVANADVVAALAIP